MTSVRRRPMRSATGPRISVPAAPARSMRKRRRLPSAFVCPSETTQSGTNASSVNQATLRSPMTTPSIAIARRRSSPRLNAALSELGLSWAKRGTNRSSASEMSATGTIASNAADEPEPDDELSGHERPERVAGVAAAVEVGHAARALVTAGIGGELGAFGVKGRNAEPAGEDEQQHERVGRRDRRPADADGGEQRPAGDQPERPAPVGPEPEQRLHQRRRCGRGEQQERGERVAEVELVGHERDQRRHAARGEIDREMAARERPHRRPIDARSHMAMLPSSDIAASPWPIVRLDAHATRAPTHPRGSLQSSARTTKIVLGADTAPRSVESDGTRSRKGFKWSLRQRANGGLSPSSASYSSWSSSTSQS